MKFVTSPWLKHNGETDIRWREWYRITPEGVWRPWICHFKLNQYFKLNDVHRLRILLSKEKPRGIHSVEISLTPTTFRVNGARRLMYATLEDFFLKGADRFQTHTFYAHLEVK